MAPPSPVRRWDLFCRVIDNHGDLGVCWRLAADLAARGEAVRLWVDDASALAWMAPQGGPGTGNVQVQPWRDPLQHEEPGDVVVEAFGCDPPAAFVERMARQARPPCWINLEYLTAESYARRSHGLPSPQQAGPGAGLVKWFFYPGFTAGTGGLLREPGLMQRRAQFDRAALLQAMESPLPPQAQLVLLFCYDNPALPGWLAGLADPCAPRPTWLWVPPGHPARQVAAWLGVAPQPGRVARQGALTAQFLPHVPQTRFDELLWAADLNLVRGEDSLVRALWAGRPFIWQIYPQHDGAHAAKLAAFLDLYLQGAVADTAAGLRALHEQWNGLAPADAGRPIPPGGPAWPGTAWQAHASAASRRLANATDLVSELLHFIQGRAVSRSG
jgi:uncharacterized repeat protein (TIGR03837 family)